MPFGGVTRYYKWRHILTVLRVYILEGLEIDYQMSRRQHISDHSQDQEEPKARLHILGPIINGHRLSPFDLYCLRQTCPNIKEATTITYQGREIQHVVLCFDSMTDVGQFQLEQAGNLKYWKAFIEGEEQEEEGFQTEFCFPDEHLKDIEEEGFTFTNGRLKLKRETSLEDELEDEKSENNDPSTHIYSDFVIPESDEGIKLDPLLLTALSTKQWSDAEEEVEVEEKKLCAKNLVNPLIHSIALTGLVYGASKLLKAMLGYK